MRPDAARRAAQVAARRARVSRLYSSGMSLREIANTERLSYAVVRLDVVSSGVTLRPPGSGNSGGPHVKRFNPRGCCRTCGRHQTQLPTRACQHPGTHRPSAAARLDAAQTEETPMKAARTWPVGPWTFYEYLEHGFTGELAGVPLYAFTYRPDPAAPEPRTGELYDSLDEAMVAAVGEKHTARRGAGGPGVGTAADWFMNMIGAR